ncbi:MAG: hypothetical protein OXC69_05750 [Candidatus Tectomicrobia bacterium]|nr:hypothetical protein [Candidatus Tectomicrobia bacterium]
MEKRDHLVKCSIALAFALLAYEPSRAPLTIAVFVCFVSLPVGSLFLRSTPRLAIATVYWSTATILVASPLIFESPHWLYENTRGVGIALGLGLFLQLIATRQTPPSD